MATEVPKWMRMQGLEYPMLLLFKEKHGERRFLITKQKDIEAACLKILAERIDEWIYDPSENDRPQNPGLSESMIDTLPPGTVKDHAVRERDRYRLDCRVFEQELEAYKAAKKALKEKDGMAAFQVLRSRRDGEYEGMEFEGFEGLK